MTVSLKKPKPQANEYPGAPASYDPVEPTIGSVAAPSGAEPAVTPEPPADDPGPLDELNEPELEVLGIKEFKPGESNIKVDPEIASISSGSSDAEDHELRRQIIEQGLLEALEGWDTGEGVILIDGHRRLPICEALGLPVRIRLMKFPNRDAAVEYRVKKQLARRGGTDTEKQYLWGRRYNQVQKRQGRRTDIETSGQSAQKLTTSQHMAQLFSIDEKTLRRYAQFARAVDKISAATTPEFRRRLLAGNLKVSRPDILKLADKTVDSAVVEQILKEGKYTRAGNQDKKPVDPVGSINRAWAKMDPLGQRQFLTGLLQDPEALEIVEEILGVAAETR